MTTAATPKTPEGSASQPVPATSPAGQRPEIARIIQSGRIAAERHSGRVRALWLLALASLVPLWLAFTPVEWTGLAWFALVPVSLLLVPRRLPRWSWPVLWASGSLWALGTLQWMRLGHPAMYLALAALAVYVGLYLPAFVVLGRRCVAAGLPLWISVPVVWTALELLRAHLLTGFAWYYLGHTQYRWSALIQIADVTGAWGVTFVVALGNGVLAGLVPRSWLKRLGLEVEAAPASSLRRTWAPVVVAAVVVVSCCIYGTIRRTDPQSFPAGPSVALIQGNFEPEVKHDADLLTMRLRVHDMLTQHAVLLQPDFIVWPETAFPIPEHNVADGVTDAQILAQMPPEALRQWGNEVSQFTAQFRSRDVQQGLAQRAQASGAALFVGLESLTAEASRLRIGNSAAFVRPDLGYMGRYDKMHRVVFGEYIPLRSVFPFLERLTPFGSGFGIDAGTTPQLFEYAGVRVAPLICFEDTVPALVRRLAAQTDAAGQPCDLLVNLTNDAWFRGSSELDQHLITAVFRCIETRTPMVRSVNGGISAIIDGNGEIREPAVIKVFDEPLVGLNPPSQQVSGLRDPATGRWRRQFTGIVFGQAPLDPRSSVYLRYGDWFAWLCAGLMLAAVVVSCFRSSERHRVPAV